MALLWMQPQAVHAWRRARHAADAHACMRVCVYHTEQMTISRALGQATDRYGRTPPSLKFKIQSVEQTSKTVFFRIDVSVSSLSFARRDRDAISARAWSSLHFFPRLLMAAGMQ